MPRCYDLNEDQENLLKKLYNEGKNDYEVAREMHLGRNRLREWRRSHNIPSHTNKKGLLPSFCPGIIACIESGESLTEVGKRYGVKRSSIAKLLKNNGYEYEVRSRPHPRWADDYQLTPPQMSVLIGELFGDGGLVYGGPNSAYYQCAHCLEQRPFLEWKYKIFLPLSCRQSEGVMIDKRTGVQSKYVQMGTWSTREFSEWRTRIYPSGQGNKVLTAQHVQYIDPLALAVWFMGDGTRGRDSVRFCVGLEINLPPIVNALNNKFGNMFGYRKCKKEWHLKVLDNVLFFNIVAKYMLPCFDYKNPLKTP